MPQSATDPRPQSQSGTARAEQTPKSFPVSRNVEDWLMKAKRARENRKIAPLNEQHGRPTIALKEKIAKFAASTGGQNGEFHWSWWEPKNYDSIADKGYEPELVRGEPYYHEGQSLWKVPIDIYRAMLQEPVARDKWQLRDKTKKDTKDITRQNPNAIEEVQMTKDGKSLLDEDE